MRSARLPGTARPALLAALAGALATALVACGGDGDDRGDGDPTPTDATGAAEPTGTPEAAWRDVDPCTLLSEEQVAQALAVAEAAPATPGDDPRRPECTWSVEQYGAELRLMLWEPPAPEALAEGNPSLLVRDRPAYVQGSNDSQCFLQVDDGDFWLALDLDADPSGASDDFCADEAVPVAEQVLEAVESQAG